MQIAYLRFAEEVARSSMLDSALRARLEDLVGSRKGSSATATTLW